VIVLERGREPLWSLERTHPALQECSIGLAESWGVDPRQAISTWRFPQPQGQLRDRLRSADYTRQQRRERPGGLLRLRLIVGEQGDVEQCDETARAAIMERARFTLALDSKGKPMCTQCRQIIELRL